MPMKKENKSASEKRKEKAKPRYHPRTKPEKMNSPKIQSTGIQKSRSMHDLGIMNPDTPNKTK
jgi:hypothetical protein